MSEDFGSNFVTIIDDDGQEFELEYIEEIEYKGQTYTAFLPADGNEEDPDYGLVVLRTVVDENNEELFESIDDDDELNDVFNQFMKILFDDEEEEETKE